MGLLVVALSVMSPSVMKLFVILTQQLGAPLTKNYMYIIYLAYLYIIIFNFTLLCMINLT